MLASGRLIAAKSYILLVSCRTADSEPRGPPHNGTSGMLDSVGGYATTYIHEREGSRSGGSSLAEISARHRLG